MFLVFKEAVHNAVRHSGCTEVRGRNQGWQNRHLVVLRVTDNGRGLRRRSSGRRPRPRRACATRARAIGGRPGESLRRRRMEPRFVSSSRSTRRAAAVLERPADPVSVDGVGYGSTRSYLLLTSPGRWPDFHEPHRSRSPLRRNRPSVVEDCHHRGSTGTILRAWLCSLTAPRVTAAQEVFARWRRRAARIGRDPPDVALIHIGLPGMSGIEGTQLLKQRYPNLLLLFLTSMSTTIASSKRCARERAGIFEEDAVGAAGRKPREAMNGGAPMSPRWRAARSDCFSDSGRRSARHTN